MTGTDDTQERDETMTRTCYTIVIAPDPEYSSPQTHYICRTFTQARDAWRAARALAALTAGHATITVVKVA